MNRLELKTLELQEIQTTAIQLIADQLIELNSTNKELISSIKELLSIKNANSKIELIPEPKSEPKQKKTKEEDIINS